MYAEGEVFRDMAVVWVEEMQRTGWGEESALESETIVWVERVVCGGSPAGRLVIGG